MKTFSDHFKLNKSQGELDFVNVPIDGDIPLFIDPFAISQRTDRWSTNCHLYILSFFEQIVKGIRSNNIENARNLLLYLKEPNETRLGMSQGKPQGIGIGLYQSGLIFNALSQSSAVRTGFLNSIEECELMIKGIARDKISDLTTNVIRSLLAEYTYEQCNLWKIPTRKVNLSAFYSLEQKKWINDYLDLPVANDRPVLLVPKAIVRWDPAYNHRKYYTNFVLDYLVTENLNSNSSLVEFLKNGRRRVKKKDLEKKYPLSKEFLYEFSKKHPGVLSEYKKSLETKEKQSTDNEVISEKEDKIAETLAFILNSIQPGSDQAQKYHDLIIGILEFIFYPSLLYPKKEHEIHEGRKRIDIVMENGAKKGVFLRLHQNKGLPCAFVVFECKNYNNEIANPELDQISGRFSPNRGKIGFICCRHFENRDLFIKRCHDTFKDDRGLIIPLDDKTILRWLALIEGGKRDHLEKEMTSLVNEIWLS